MEDCIFCKIIKKEISSNIVYEDDKTLAFLDINPINKGHTLVTLKKHYETIMDTPEDLLNSIIKIVKKLSIAISKMSDGIYVCQNNKEAAGQIVPHLHFHIIPRLKNDGFEYTWPKKKYEKNEAEKYAQKIKSLL